MWFLKQSLRTSVVPDFFEQVYVSPVHKCVDLSEISNIDPYFCNLEKAFERLIFKYVYNHYLDNNVLTSFQS